MESQPLSVIKASSSNVANKANRVFTSRSHFPILPIHTKQLNSQVENGLVRLGCQLLGKLQLSVTAAVGQRRRQGLGIKPSD